MMSAPWSARGDTRSSRSWRCARPSRRGLARERTEQERLDAGLVDYDPDDVPPATDDPVPTDVTESDVYQEEPRRGPTRGQGRRGPARQGSRGHASDPVRPRLTGANPARLHRHRRTDHPRIRPCGATVVTVGAGLRLLSYRNRPLLSGYRPDELPPRRAASCLHPGRIASATVTIASAVRTISCRSPRSRAGTPCTGWVSRSNGYVVNRVESGVVLGLRLQPTRGYPFRLDLRIAYELDARGLRVTLGRPIRGSLTHRTAAAPIPT